VAINRDKILQEAQKLADKKRYDKAIAEYQKVVAEDPNDVRTLLKIGDLYLRIQQFAEAINTYDRVATYYSVQGFSVKAVAVYKQIREIIQKHAPHLEDRFGHVVPKLAELLTQLDLRSDALAYYDEMATRLQVVGRDRDAIDVFQKVVSLDPTNPVSHLRLADAYTRVRDFDGSTQEFAVAAEILLKIGRKDDALRVVERILQYRSEPRFARLAAEIHLERGQPTDPMAALSKLQVAFKSNPKDLETLSLLSRAFDGLGQPTKAVEVQKEAARIAHETKQRDLFEQLLMVLLQRAPGDEGVRQLAALGSADSRAPSAPPAPPPPSAIAPRAPLVPTGVGAPFAPQQQAAPFAPQQQAAPFAPQQQAAPFAPQQQAAPFAPQQQAAPFAPQQQAAPFAPQQQAAPFAPQQQAAPFAPQQQAAPFAPAQARAPMPSAPGGFPAPTGAQPRPPMPSAPGFKPPPPKPIAREEIDDEVPSSDVEEISVVDLVVEDLDLDVESVEPASEDEQPFALRASYPPDDAIAPGASGPHRIRDLLARTEASRRAGDFEDAAEALRLGIREQPSARELRERLCDVLIEAGDQDGAVVEMLAFARYMVETGDPDAAARLLDEVLLLEPDNRAAFDLLGALGYSVSTPDEPPPPATEPPRAPSYDPLAPLPSYDLEDLTSDSLPMGPGVGPPGAPPIELDDPFAAESTSFGMPAYQLDEDRPRPSSAGVLDESALEEMEFFTTHGMLDEAEGILSEQMARLPNHPLLLEKLRELGELRAQQAPAPVAEPAVQQRHDESVTAYAPSPASQAPRSLPREVTVDRAYDIAHALDEMDSILGGLGDAPAPPPLGQQVSVEQVFEQFKAGIAAQIAESDAATHYDLGVAYKEMGLTADAIHEFELASRDPTRECVCQSMIGMLHIQNGELDTAIDAFIRGLHASQKTPDQETALTYEIGNAYEMRHNQEQALYYFQLVARLDPSHRDPRGSVAERISNLERATGQDKAPPKAVAVGAGDEFDAAFDDLFNPKG
jgi:tetratricopeptide (TPR) repeat protein